MVNYNVTVAMSGTPNQVTGQYNVKSYGAVGDGVTDDSTPIQTCFSAAAAAGRGEIVFPPDGNYLMDSQVALTSADNLTITGKSNLRFVNIGGDVCIYAVRQHQDQRTRNRRRQPSAVGNRLQGVL